MGLWPASGRILVQQLAVVVGMSVGACLVGCSDASAVRRPTSSAGLPSPPTGRKPPPAPPGDPRSRLNEQQAVWVEETRGHVEALAARIGERHAGRMWELASAADYIADKLETFGLAVQRQGIDVGEAVAQNLIAEVPGAALASEVVVVGAHYDTAVGSAGTRTAAAAAVSLALARAFARARPQRTLRFAYFCNAEPPFLGTAQSGSRTYVKSVAIQHEEVVIALTLDSLGSLTSRANSQRDPTQAKLGFGTTGDFIALIGPPAAKKFLAGALSTFRRASGLAARTLVLERAEPELGASDMWSFVDAGYPALSVTDTGSLRLPDPAASAGTPEVVGFEALARATSGLEVLIREMTGSPANVSEK